jgi:tetratricopeptide (TPR) repeat protein
MTIARSLDVWRNWIRKWLSPNVGQHYRDSELQRGDKFMAGRAALLLVSIALTAVDPSVFAAPPGSDWQKHDEKEAKPAVQSDSKWETLNRQPVKSWENPVSGHSKVSEHLSNLGENYCILGKYDEAKPLFQQALALDEKAFGPNHVDVARDLHNLAGLYQAQRRYSEAEPLYKRCLSIRQRDYGPEHLLVAESLTNLARLYQDEGYAVKAEPLFKRVIAIYESSLGPNNPLLADALDSYSKLLRKERRTAEADRLDRRAKAIWSEQ